MLRRLSAVVLALLILGSSGGSAEALHSFLGHTDTVHTHTDEAVASPQHTHCSFLDFSLPPFLAWNPPLLPVETAVVYEKDCTREKLAKAPVLWRRAFDTRGPPAFA